MVYSFFDWKEAQDFRRCLEQKLCISRRGKYGMNLSRDYVVERIGALIYYIVKGDEDDIRRCNVFYDQVRGLA